MKTLMTFVLLFHFSFHAITAHAAVWGQEELAEKARVQSYDSKKSFEKLFQARRNVSRKVGLLLPSFHLGVILNALGGGFTKGYLMPLQLIAPMIGFIFPSNWFALKESKLAFEAEKRFYLSSIANNINTIEVLYLETHKTVMAIELYEKMASDLDGILKSIHSQDEVNPIPFTSYAKLALISERINSELALLKQIYWTQKEEIGIAIGLTEQERKEFVLKRLETIDSSFEPLDYQRFREKVMTRALEINGGQYLSLSAEFAVKKRRWEFLSVSPDPESAMGAGYSAQIDIAKSEKRILDLELAEFKERFINQIEDVSRTFPLQKDLIVRADSVQSTATRFYTLAKTKISYTNAQEFKDYADAVTEYMQATAESIDLRHQILATESNYRRLIFQGKAYSKLIPTLWLKSPEDKLTREQKKENRKINKAIKKGEVTLPADEFLEETPNA